jgi:hypothetical protein
VASAPDTWQTLHGGRDTVEERLAALERLVAIQPAVSPGRDQSLTITQEVVT